MSGLSLIMMASAISGRVSIANESLAGSNGTSCSITYHTDGTTTANATSPPSDPTWVEPATTDVAQNFQIRFSNPSGDTGEIFGAPFNTWLDFSANRTVGLNAPPFPPGGTFNVTFDVEIRDSANVVRDSATDELTTVSA